MKPRSFDYRRPREIDDVVSLLAEYGEDARILAGGQSLIPMMNFRLLDPQVLIDIRHVADLGHIRVENGYVEVGAAVTQNRLLAWSQLGETLPLLAATMPWVGHFQTRNRGTVCGSIAHADPSSEIPLSFAMLEGEAVLRSSRGERIVSASEFQLGMLTTARESDELLVAVRFPIHAGAKAAFREVARRHGDFAIVGVGALRGPDGGVTLGVAGGAGAPLVETFGDGALRDRIGRLAERLEAQDDIHATAAMRRDIVRRLAPIVAAEAQA